jgi:hypothetical protein
MEGLNAWLSDVAVLDETPRALTKAMFDQVIASTFVAGSQPTVIIAHPYQRAVFVTIDTADREQWNWRRTKRELRKIGLVRKGVRREYQASSYHKRALDG